MSTIRLKCATSSRKLVVVYSARPYRGNTTMINKLRQAHRREHKPVSVILRAKVPFPFVRFIILITIFSLCTNSIPAQTFLSPKVQLVSDCIKNSVENNTTRRQGPYLTFDCFGETARILYNSLSSSHIAHGEVPGTEGLARARSRTLVTQDVLGHKMVNGCYHWYQGRDGSAISSFSCVFSIPVGTYLD